MNKEHFIQSPSDFQPHVVLLGAGASRASFPHGDASGRRLPLMDDLMEVVGLTPLIEAANVGLENERNLEEIYSKLAGNPKCRDLVKEIEGRIDTYFSSLCLPKKATIYDFLLLSLRRKDAIFTFNWDPFLFDAYKRNRHIAPLPEIFFLHGNVRIGICRNHPDKWGERQGLCPSCSSRFEGVPLLYPVGDKDYSSDKYIRASWEAARCLFEEAFVLTIFGYGAPVSDADAVGLLRLAWTGKSNRRISPVEIVDIESSSVLYERWKSFTPNRSSRMKRSIWESWIMMYPRRSVESTKYFSSLGEPVETFALDLSEESLCRVQNQIFDIAKWEIEDD